MKQYTVLSLLISSLILLSSCAAEPVKEEHTVDPSASKEASQGSSLELSTVDQALIDGALSLNDISYCDQIGEGEVKEKCKEIVNNSNAMERAKNELNAELCNQVTDEDEKQVCQINVQVGLDTQKAALQEQEQVAVENEKMRTIAESNDHTQCKTLSTPERINDCEFNILLNKAAIENNIALCDLASNSDGVNLCRESFDEAKSLMQASDATNLEITP